MIQVETILKRKWAYINSLIYILKVKLYCDKKHLLDHDILLCLSDELSCLELYYVPDFQIKRGYDNFSSLILCVVYLENFPTWWWNVTKSRIHSMVYKSGDT